MKRVLKILFTPFICLVAFGISSCEKKAHQFVNQSSVQLFNESASLINEYITKIQVSKDTAELDSLLDLFDKKLIDINFSYPPDTDLKMSEQDNDSLYRLLKELRQQRDRKLQVFKIKLEKDS